MATRPRQKQKSCEKGGREKKRGPIKFYPNHTGNDTRNQVRNSWECDLYPTKCDFYPGMRWYEADFDISKYLFGEIKTSLFWFVVRARNAKPKS